MKPITCLDDSCKGSDHCSMCINRNAAAKKGYELIQLIEKIPASIEQTEAVSAAQAYMEFCSKLSEEDLKLKFMGYKSDVSGYSELNGYEVSLMDIDKFGEQFQRCFVMDKGDGINFVKSYIETLSEVDMNSFLSILTEVGERCGGEEVGFGGSVEEEIKRLHGNT